MEEVVNRRPCKDIEALYGSKLTRHLLMARVNLILAICSTIHDLPDLLSAELSESQEKRSSTSCLPDVSSSDESSGLQLIARKLTLGEFKTSSRDAKSLLDLHSRVVPEEVEARERMDLLLWLCCKLAVVRSLVGHFPGTAICSGADSSVEALGLLKEGLEEAKTLTLKPCCFYKVSTSTHTVADPEKTVRLCYSELRGTGSQTPPAHTETTAATGF
ncbi:hypothetical protein cypCar_00001731 [Cyprinus carpio]|nr:hypothetical protein cypCar_00001731 [Cyprinus carpio]